MYGNFHFVGGKRVGRKGKDLWEELEKERDRPGAELFPQVEKGALDF